MKSNKIKVFFEKKKKLFTSMKLKRIMGLLELRDMENFISSGLVRWNINKKHGLVKLDVWSF